MLAFGAGTLPAVMGAGLFTGMLSAMARVKHLRQIAGLLIIAMALVTTFWPMNVEHFVQNGKQLDQNTHLLHSM
jgi:sulfite exporter TauE/SafE